MHRAATPGSSPADALDRAAEVGVTRIVQVGCDVDGSRWAVEAAERWPSVVAGVAIHPNDAARLGDGLPDALAAIEALARHPRVRAVGETGLDYYRTREPAGHAAQREAFAAHIALATAYDKTLVIHDRDAHADVLDVLDAEGVPDRVVMHCFSGDADFARACLDRGRLPLLRRTGHLQAERGPAGGARGDPAGPDPGRDRRALPDPDAVPRPAQRLLPDPAHRPVHGRDARRRPGRRSADA